MTRCHLQLSTDFPAGKATPRRWWLFVFLLTCGVVLWAQAAPDFAATQKEYLKGNYDEVIKTAQEVVAESPNNEDWRCLLGEALLTVGRVTEAESALSGAIARLPQSLRLQWLGREVALANGKTEEAARHLASIRQLYSARPWSYRDAPNLIVFGRAALVIGADAKDVQNKLYATAEKASPGLRDVYLARGELALEKHDFALAAKAFEAGLKTLPDDPDLNCGLAHAHENGDRKVMLAAVESALKENPRHVPTLLLLAEHRIDAEEYPEATKLIDEIVAVNPVHPDAWALRAVLAHLSNDSAGERRARANALLNWKNNPRVDWLIGHKLSQKYRFAESASHQRRALEFDPAYQPAKVQLANDLLRLGEEDEGWKLAQDVHEKDGYDVEAFNLVTLHDTMAKYATVTNADFVVRMTQHEADVYGREVLDLLTRAKRQLTEKYGAELARPTYVEIFADPKDFAVRTFGLPDIPGFLGVCFGRVVTANSPAATESLSTYWQSVLWHEFCHVVTLQLTQNKMPRWLSEGISVYEERQAKPSWGQHMTPQYRELILKEKGLTPVGEMSGAFLAPPSQEHLQFAYYEASLVVEFLVSRHGPEKLKAVLRDLREGKEINRALADQIASLPTIEKEFSAFARERANALGPKLDWEKPPAEVLLPGAESELADWSKKHPDNYWLLLQQAQQLITDKKWKEAKVPLERLLALYPDQRGGDSALRLLAAAQRALNETEAERATLEKLAALDDEAADADRRLIELAEGASDWPAVTLNAHRFLEVNPLVAFPWRSLAHASMESGDNAAAIAADRVLLLLDPPNPAEVHFQLAQLLHRSGDSSARREVLLALEDAPRNRSALKLLTELSRPEASSPEKTGPDPIAFPKLPALQAPPVARP